MENASAATRKTNHSGTLSSHWPTARVIHGALLITASALLSWFLFRPWMHFFVLDDTGKLQGARVTGWNLACGGLPQLVPSSVAYSVMFLLVPTVLLALSGAQKLANNRIWPVVNWLLLATSALSLLLLLYFVSAVAEHHRSTWSDTSSVAVSIRLAQGDLPTQRLPDLGDTATLKVMGYSFTEAFLASAFIRTNVASAFWSTRMVLLLVAVPLGLYAVIGQGRRQCFTVSQRATAFFYALLALGSMLPWNVAYLTGPGRLPDNIAVFAWWYFDPSFALPLQERILLFLLSVSGIVGVAVSLTTPTTAMGQPTSRRLFLVLGPVVISAAAVAGMFFIEMQRSMISWIPYAAKWMLTSRSGFRLVSVSVVFLSALTLWGLVTRREA